MNIIKTNHAKQRLQQRGINDQMIEVIENFGITKYDNKGGVRMMIPKNRILELMKKQPTIKSLLEQVKGIYLVLSAHDHSLVTVGHYYR